MGNFLDGAEYFIMGFIGFIATILVGVGFFIGWLVFT